MSATPFVKWAGGKRWLAPTLSPMITAHLQNNPQARYIEPFLGGGAIALSLDRPRALLSDLCAPLINVYRWVKSTPESVLRELAAVVARGTDEATYYKIRRAYIEEKGSLLRAARFLYLNHTCFNGLMRTNSQGQFNVPYGFRTKPSFPQIKNLTAVKNTLVAALVYAADFREALGRARPGDLVYADSPYDGTYEGYTGSGFSETDQADLANALRRLADRGVVVLATNADTARVRDWYTWATVQPLAEHHSIAANERRRGVVGCLWITSRPDFQLAPSVIPTTVDDSDSDSEVENADADENERGMP